MATSQMYLEENQRLRETLAVLHNELEQMRATLQRVSLDYSELVSRVDNTQQVMREIAQGSFIDSLWKFFYFCQQHYILVCIGVTTVGIGSYWYYRSSNSSQPNTMQQVEISAFVREQERIINTMQEQQTNIVTGLAQQVSESVSDVVTTVQNTTENMAVVTNNIRQTVTTGGQFTAGIYGMSKLYKLLRVFLKVIK